MSKIITIQEIKSWHYYAWNCSKPDFPTIPKKVEKVIYSRKERSEEPFVVENESDIISLTSFRKRVKNYLKDHLENKDIVKFDPNFNKKNS